MIKKEKDTIEELYERNSDILDCLKLESSLKEQIQNLNKSLYNIKVNNIKEPISIYIENIEQYYINIIIDHIIRILNDYEIDTKKPNFIEERYFDIRAKDLVVVKDYELCEDISNVGRIKDEANTYKTNLIMANEGKYSKNFFREKDLKNRIVFHLIGEDNTSEKILLDLQTKLKQNNIKCDITNEEWQEIIDNHIKENKCYQSNCAEYLYKKALNEKIINDSKKIDKACYSMTVEEVKKETIKLEDLTGLKNVKKELKSLKNYLAMQKRIGNVLKNNYLNMLFLGSPGTGKTTVGRIYASILYELGYIKENKLVEIIPTDLMANYIGQTKDKTRKILDKARGGVLFIDEAYLISKVTYSDGFASYMSEAVVELMKYMEDPANIIIFAGYPIETRKIYDANPGMKSRICKEIIFEDYSSDELYNILKNNLKNYGFKISKKAEKGIKQIITTEKAKKNFGNARYCNVLMQQLLMNYANNHLEEDTYEIDEEDIKLEKDSIFQIGFKEE